MSSSKGVSLVTGSGQGIGRAIALRLADDGYDVAVNDIPSNKDNLESLKVEIESKGCKALVVTADVSQEDQVKHMVDTVVETLGGLDVVRYYWYLLHISVEIPFLCVDGCQCWHLYLQTFPRKCDCFFFSHYIRLRCPNISHRCRVGQNIQHQYPWCHAVLPSRSEADDRARARRQNYRQVALPVLFNV